MDAPMDNTTTSVVRFGDWIAEGWRMFVEQWKGWVVNILVVLLIILAPTIPYLVIFFGLMAGSASSNTAELPVLLFWPVTLAFVLVLSVLGMFLAGGLYNSALNQLRGGIVSPRDLFSAKESFPQLVGAAILMGILVFLGTMLCIIPGFIVQGALFFTIPLIIDRKLGVIEAMQTSFELTKKNLLMFTLFVFVVGIISQLGAYLCYVGLIVSYPLHFTIGSVAYRDCFGIPGARAFLPAHQASPAIYSQPQVHAQVPQSVVQSICPTCQAEVPSTAIYCPRCGRSMGPDR